MESKINFQLSQIEREELTPETGIVSDVVLIDVNTKDLFNSESAFMQALNLYSTSSARENIVKITNNIEKLLEDDAEYDIEKITDIFKNIKKLGKPVYTEILYIIYIIVARVDDRNFEFYAQALVNLMKEENTSKTNDEIMFDEIPTEGFLPDGAEVIEEDDINIEDEIIESENE